MVFCTILAISPPILIHFGCSKAHFVGGGYRNPYPYPYPSIPYPLPTRVSKPLIIPNWGQVMELLKLMEHLSHHLLNLQQVKK